MKLKFSSINFRYCLLLLFLVCISTSCRQKSKAQREETVYKLGDSISWANPDYDTNNWSKKIAPKGGEVFWIRSTYTILEAPQPFQSYGIDMVNTFGEFEIYWDGELIGKNGNPGQEETLERQGEMWRVFRIPNHLTQKGPHTLALRKSVYHHPETYWHRGFVYDYDYLKEYPLVYTAFMHIFAGAFLLAALYLFFLYLGNKKEKPILLFSISCFLFFALILMEFIRNYISIHYSQHYIRMEIIGALIYTIAILVPIYFALQFPFPKRKPIFIVYVIILTYLFYNTHFQYDRTAYNMSVWMWCFSTIIILYAVYKRLKGAWIVLLSLLIGALINYIAYFDTSLFASFGVMVLGMFYILAIKAKEQRIAYEHSLLQSTRLRLELLKKNIQPHFIMNSLTSLMDWVEESPQKGVSFIEALAKEFDLLNQIEDQKLIPISQEIELCQTHIDIMQYRKEITYTLEQKNIDHNTTVPPAIFHTLLENGITHCIPLTDNTIRFELKYKATDLSKTYTFTTYAKVRHPDKNIVEGTGIKYIKARLTESYGDQWSFTSEPIKHGWENCIKINI